MKSQDSNTELVQRLFVKHASAIRGFIRAFLPDFNQADDVLQESFLTATAKADSFQEGTNFLAWATAIAKLKTLEFHRKNRSAGETLSPEVIDALCETPPPTPSDGFQAMLRDCLAELPHRAKEALDLRYGDACKPAEVAQRLNWTAESVYVTLSRARAFLRKCVERKMKQQDLR